MTKVKVETRLGCKSVIQSTGQTVGSWYNDVSIPYLLNFFCKIELSSPISWATTRYQGE